MAKGLKCQEEDSGTVVLSQEPGDLDEGSATVVLAREPAESEEASATVVLNSGEKAATNEEVEETRYVTGEAATLARVAEVPLLIPEPEADESAVTDRRTSFGTLNEARRAAEAFLSRGVDEFAALKWEAKFILILSGVGLVVASIMAIIALRTNSALVGVLAGLPLIFGWAYTAVVLARHLTVRPVAELAEGLNVLGRGEKPPILTRKDYPELDKLSTEIGRMVGLARSSSASTDSGVSEANDSDGND